MVPSTPLLADTGRPHSLDPDSKSRIGWRPAILERALIFCFSFLFFFFLPPWLATERFVYLTGKSGAGEVYFHDKNFVNAA
jgi:hypothetical protein